ncbi:SGNH/GDSL hydrolase family protein [Streptomyces sp. DSM 44917]|uniref:SGNH/GDSL hydrolase family protein n=1 Tax=Streptomyces boetiae TaxID=3075541 RepID=A0ABU2L4B5_9ACTN|nr:SGNH/GDSL hydrolase family protein [Streptomyces sp. DSM 44917]MDT0306404.1 SGNH/GDSL hydrolase family protein [Streptomyces sp. DSM 44917]
MRRNTTVTAVSAAALAAVLGWGAGPGHASEAQEPLRYVAMGDSAAAGPLIPDQVDRDCLRSDRNYPSVAAAELGAELTDVSCSGATLEDFSGGSSPQYEALDESTDLVTVTIGGNDTELVALTLGCVNLLPPPLGRSCADEMTAGGTDRVAEAIRAWEPAFGEALAEIRRRAPHARILVAGYGTYLRDGGCWPAQPIWSRDADYVQGSVDALNDALRRQAEAHGAGYVDLAAVSVGHDTCAPAGERYLEGLVAVSPAAPLHPNARGMAAFGAEVARAARG